MRKIISSSPTRIFFGSLFGAAIVAIAFVFSLALWLSDAMNVLARENSVTLIDSALQSKFRRIGTLTKDYAQRDESYEVIETRNDAAALQVLGRGATLGSAFDFLLVTQPDGSPIYGYRTGVTQSDLAFIDPATTAEFVALFESGDVSQDAVLTGFTSVEGIVALVAVSRVLPLNDTTTPSSEWPLLFGMLQLNESRLQLVSGDMVVDKMVVLGPDDPMDIAENAAQLPLVNKSGNLISTLVWEPPQPGDALFQRALPALTLVSALLMLGSLVAGYLTNRQSQAVHNARRLAGTDKMTGLLNSRGLDDLLTTPDLKKALKDARVATLYLDLNGLKQLNDNLGHEAGNIALQVTAGRLKDSVRQTDYVARIGGDEFLCLIIDDSPVEAAGKVADRIVTLTRPAVRFGEYQQAVTPSIGIALSDGFISWDALIARADMAMYQAKRQNIQQPIYYTEKLAETADVNPNSDLKQSA